MQQEKSHIHITGYAHTRVSYGETVICILIWSTFHFSTRSLEMHFKSAVFLNIHFIYSESLQIIFRRSETPPPWRLAPTLSLSTCLSKLRVVGRGPARDVGLRPLGRGETPAGAGRKNSVTTMASQKSVARLSEEGRANSVTSQNSVARFRRKIARKLLAPNMTS